MIRLLKMELKRNSLKTYKIATLIICVVMLGFTYLIAAIPTIEESGTDTELFMTYHFIIGLSCIVCMGMFSVMAGVLGAKFIVEDYSGNNAVLILSYPIKREKVLAAKVIVVVLSVFKLMMLCEGLVLGVFLLTETIFPLCMETITLSVVLYGLFSLIIFSIMSGLIGVLSVWFGFWKKSVAATIVSSFLIVSGICQLAAQIVTLPELTMPALLIMGLIGVIITVFVYANLCSNVKRMEV